MSYKRKELQSIHFPAFKASLLSQEGKTFAITGTTSGTGFVAAKTIRELGGNVIVLNRSSERATQSFSELENVPGSGQLHSVVCDLQSFASVRKAIIEVQKIAKDGLDVLCNNAGVMALADIATEDGFDVQMQTNHLSHFLLTAELFPLLEKAANSKGDARIVSHSSIARMNPSKKLEGKYFEKRGGDLGGNGASMVFGGARWKRYNQTKLANAAFTAALHERLQKSGSKVKALVAHPGVADTELQVTSAKEGGMGDFFTNIFMGLAGQSMEDGTMGILACMCLPDAQSGMFYGPGSGVMATKGKALPFALESFYDNSATRDLLWEKSCEAIGKEFII